jgi:hypothetical protein
LATYPIIHSETGEQKEVTMSVHDWDQWKKDNPLWQRDWSDPSTCPNSGEVGEMQDKIFKSHPGWKEVMTKVKKAGASQSQIQI